MLLFDNPEIQEGATFDVGVVAGATLNGSEVFTTPLDLTVPVTVTRRMMELGANKDEIEAEK